MFISSKSCSDMHSTKKGAIKKSKSYQFSKYNDLAQALTYFVVTLFFILCFERGRIHNKIIQQDDKGKCIKNSITW